MKRVDIHHLASVFVAACLLGCGGGGGNESVTTPQTAAPAPAPAPAPTPTPTPTPTSISPETVVKTSAAAAEALNFISSDLIGLIKSQGLLPRNWPSPGGAISCTNGGSGSVSATKKNAAQYDLQAGDTVSVTYLNCSNPSSGYSNRNGSATITALNNISKIFSGGYSENSQSYSIVFQNLSATFQEGPVNGVQTNYEINGEAEVTITDLVQAFVTLSTPGVDGIKLSMKIPVAKSLTFTRIPKEGFNFYNIPSFQYKLSDTFKYSHSAKDVPSQLGGIWSTLYEKDINVEGKLSLLGTSSKDLSFVFNNSRLVTSGPKYYFSSASSYSGNTGVYAYTPIESSDSFVKFETPEEFLQIEWLFGKDMPNKPSYTIASDREMSVKYNSINNQASTGSLKTTWNTLITRN